MGVVRSPDDEVVEAGVRPRSRAQSVRGGWGGGGRGLVVGDRIEPGPLEDINGMTTNCDPCHPPASPLTVDVDLDGIRQYLAGTDVEFAILFGSRARGSAGEASDVDIALRFPWSWMPVSGSTGGTESMRPSRNSST